ncbi:serine hydrolase domain-containing protein [Mesorhizobium newzealandense]|uniref:Serine hydrolase domain-containing protein n=1 Tax=Mesorhizobium newzealandense TaxID=1300302 RepID=A0ABW4U517_9HYPH
MSRRDFIAAASVAGLLPAVTGTTLADTTQSASTMWAPAKALDAAMDDAVASGRIVGTSVVAAQNGNIVYQRAAGFKDREAREPAGIDDVFRLASMTKPIVCVTALALVDAGRLTIDDPVTRWLPDFRPKLTDGRQPIITIRHLLTHTAGLGYGFLEPEDGSYHRLKISDGLDRSGLSLGENVARIASAPLLFEPGTAWHYSVAIDVLGAVIEQVTGTTLAQAVRAIVTGPLGMTSVDFIASAARPPATPYGDASPEPVRMTEPFTLKFGRSGIVYSPARAFDEAAFFSGGVGMVGTAHDYLRFAEAMRTGGPGIIRPETVAAMTQNAIGDLQVSAGPGFGWGLGVQILLDPAKAGSPVTAGAWNWSGVYGTNFWVDPAKATSVVVLTNTAVAGMTGEFPLAIRRAVYAA